MEILGVWDIRDKTIGGQKGWGTKRLGGKMIGEQTDWGTQKDWGTKRLGPKERKRP